MKKIFQFLGSVYFSLLLIALTVVFAMGGTLIESWSKSHLFAARFTYHNPLFHMLLWGYFFNILFATLRRFPFQKAHIPFIITHLGLLMILGGLLVKSHFGLQATMELSEGGGSNTVTVANSYALYIENRTESVHLPLKKGMLGTVGPSFENLEIALIDWTAHSHEQIEGWIKGNFGHILGLPPFPVIPLLTNAPPISLKTPEYNIYALTVGRIEEVSEEVYFDKPALVFVQDSQKNEHLLAFNKKGERYFQTFDRQLIWIFDKGFGGYGLSAELPMSFPSIELITALTHVCERSQPHRKQEELTPRLRLLVSDGRNQELISLTYDRAARGYKWPILNGSYLIRFQPQECSIPFSVRLREARQINYPDSQQPYSFESDLVIDQEETTLSMNHVFEKQGHRFYMANLISPAFGAKRIALVVNHDPAKYWLTYPGAILLILGTTMLYRKRLTKS